MKIIEVTKLNKFTPPLHYGVQSRELVGKSTGSDNVVVVLAEMEKSGSAGIHTHADSEHVFYVLKGELTVKTKEGEAKIEQGNAMFIRPGEPHEAHNETKDKVAYLVITSPPT